MSARSRSRGSRVALAFLFAAAAAGAMAITGQARQQVAFPHADHEGLFPVCTGCHTGVPRGDASAFYPSPDLCARCHDGEDQPRVSWTGPSRQESNLVFDHPDHQALLEGTGNDLLSCESCHSEAGRGRMAVDEHEELETCFSCHAHEASSHFTDADCSTCHEPLASSGFGVAHIEALPVPEDHEATGFIAQAHGRAARSSTERCATCHTVERCLTCHVDPQRRPIQAMPAAPEDMTLPEAVAHYPVPASHTDEDWLYEHGRGASSPGRCNTCHTSDDCTACHVPPLPALAQALPGRGQARAPGVMLAARAPETHASPFFLETHANLAASDIRSCNTCHTQSFCSACHDAAPGSGNVYHPPDFVSRHAAEAYGRTDECSTCHNSAAFCRECHLESGMGAEGRLGRGFHTAEPLWLLRHGQAARQNLESCASCHEQRECTQCHGVLGAFKVNPHGRDFDAQAAWERNPRTCFACHIGNPLEGGGS